MSEMNKRKVQDKNGTESHTKILSKYATKKKFSFCDVIFEPISFRKFQCLFYSFVCMPICCVKFWNETLLFYDGHKNWKQNIQRNVGMGWVANDAFERKMNECKRQNGIHKTKLNQSHKRKKIVSCVSVFKRKKHHFYDGTSKRIQNLL